MQLLAITLGMWALASQVGVPTDDLAAAKALYAVADYEAALKVLSADQGSATDEVDTYRALCLLALGRMEEVEQQLQALIVRNPAFTMSDADVTPRLVELFQQTRRRLLPGIVKDSYAAAQASFESGRYAEASSRLKALLALLASGAAFDQDATVAHDLQQVAQHFLDLAAAAQAPDSSPALEPPSDEAAIAQVVRRYTRAYEALDVESVVRIFQGENPNPLRAAFEALKSQKVDARNVRITVDGGGGSATVRLTWAVEAVPKIGSPSKTQVPATLRMQKVAAGEWRIVARR
jgi:ketosteroid isomerase-like protein